MNSGESIDLIRIEGDGNSLILRITGKEHETLVGEYIIETARFVRGSMKTWVSAYDLHEWRDALDAFDLEDVDIAWREYDRASLLLIERIENDSQDRVYVTLKDVAASLTAVKMVIPLDDSWFDEAYERLDLVWKTWAPAET